MFEVGFSEILLIFAIALLVLGPEQLPKLAADVGRWAGRARAMARQLRTQLEQEVQFDPMKDRPASNPTIHSTAPAATSNAGGGNSSPAQQSSSGRRPPAPPLPQSGRRACGDGRKR